jgi:hypothetical protein
MAMNWTIELAEKPLKIGIWDNIVYGGRDASHSFLRLKNSAGEVVSELHGLCYDPVTGSTSDARSNTLGRLLHSFNGKKKNEPFAPARLVMFVFDFHRTKHEKLSAQPLLRGMQDDILRTWREATELAEEINGQHVEYRAIDIFRSNTAQNCHSASAFLMDALGLELPPHVRCARPGYDPERLEFCEQR